MSSTPVGGGNGSREKHRWSESKVYTRKSHKSGPKQNPSSQIPVPEPLPASSPQTLAPPPNPSPPHPTLVSPPPPISPNSDQNTPENEPETVRPLVSEGKSLDGQPSVTISPGSGSRDEVREVRNRLVEELEQVRAVTRRLEAKERQLAAPITPTYSRSQLSGTGSQPFFKTASVVAPLRRQLSVSLVPGQVDSYVSEGVEREKRTPKANQYYQNSDFLLAKDKFPPPVSSKKSKSLNGSRRVDVVSSDLGKVYAHAFKSCTGLLSRLMKHKHGWVFNTPVDVKGLGLHDYYNIISHPMDLGTVKSRLNSNWYKSPREFAEDVRLTFHNAMTYNPKGQDVHIMAEQLLAIFEERWPAIEAELNAPSYLVAPKKAPPPPLDMRRILERSDSTTHPALQDSTPRTLSYTPHSGRTPALKKPKAKDPNKRDMTFDEKQKLSNHLQNLPSEKLDIIVQIIKKRNTSLSQHDDEIEVDIDSVDNETLWELDRFVTNYKKSLSKHKRRAELALQARLEAERNMLERNMQQNQAPETAERPGEGTHNPSSSPPMAEDKKGDNESRSSSSCSSSSDSGSSSSDSDSDSSSG